MAHKLWVTSIAPIELGNQSLSYGNDTDTVDIPRIPVGTYTDASGESVEGELPDKFSGVGQFRYANGEKGT